MSTNILFRYSKDNVKLSGTYTVSVVPFRLRAVRIFDCILTIDPRNNGIKFSIAGGAHFGNHAKTASVKYLHTKPLYVYFYSNPLCRVQVICAAQEMKAYNQLTNSNISGVWRMDPPNPAEATFSLPSIIEYRDNLYFDPNEDIYYWDPLTSHKELEWPMEEDNQNDDSIIIEAENMESSNRLEIPSSSQNLRTQIRAQEKIKKDEMNKITQRRDSHTEFLQEVMEEYTRNSRVCASFSNNKQSKPRTNPPPSPEEATQHNEPESSYYNMKNWIGETTKITEERNLATAKILNKATANQRCEMACCKTSASASDTLNEFINSIPIDQLRSISEEEEPDADTLNNIPNK